VVLLGDILWLPVESTVPISGSIETLVADETLHTNFELSPSSIIIGLTLNEPIDGTLFNVVFSSKAVF
jgi:hypothetical protein